MGGPRENGYIESFSARLRDDLLNSGIFYRLRKVSIVIEAWQRHYNAVRPHATLRYRPPARRSSSRLRQHGRLRTPGQLRRPRRHCLKPGELN